MNTNFELLDYIIFIGYALLILSVGLWVSRDKKGHEKTAEDYFLAGKSLPWWAIGTSLIAANISAEQFIGMSGSGFALGLAIASYEWMAAITLIIVGKYFLPIFIEKGLYTIPEFVEKRYSKNLKTILAIFWIHRPVDRLSFWAVGITILRATLRALPEVMTTMLQVRDP